MPETAVLDIAEPPATVEPASFVVAAVPPPTTLREVMRAGGGTESELTIPVTEPEIVPVPPV
jgi:hypothetical protein